MFPDSRARHAMFEAQILFLERKFGRKERGSQRYFDNQNAKFFKRGVDDGGADGVPAKNSSFNVSCGFGRFLANHSITLSLPINESASSFSKIWIVSTGPPQMNRQAPIEAFLLGRS